MLVRSILKGKGADVFTVSPDISVIEAVRELNEKRVGAFLVCDKDNAVIGILSERDVVRSLAEKGDSALGGTVGDLMTRDVKTCTPDDTIDHIMSLMTGRRFRHVPVMDQGRLVGIVSIGDVVKHKIAETELEAQSMKDYIATG
ncbi:MAG: CBS domain-containing protein [Sphingomonadales bacterium]